jgi:hypothetical protein
MKRIRGSGSVDFYFLDPSFFFLFFFLYLLLLFFLNKQKNETVRFSLPPLKEIRPRIY